MKELCLGKAYTRGNLAVHPIPAPWLARPLPIPQPDAWAIAVRRDEDDAGGLEGGADGGQRSDRKADHVRHRAHDVEGSHQIHESRQSTAACERCDGAAEQGRGRRLIGSNGKQMCPAFSGDANFLDTEAQKAKQNQR